MRTRRRLGHRARADQCADQSDGGGRKDGCDAARRQQDEYELLASTR
jgi:hypothetical protein